MKKNYKKTTLAKNIINSASDLKDLNYLDKSIGEVYDNIKKDSEIMQKQLNHWNELHSEFLKDKKAFIDKYAKPKTSNSSRIIQNFLKFQQ